MLMQKHWGHLHIMRRELQAVLKRGKPTGDYIELWHLQCDCGNTITINREEFPGRNVMRACGLPDCIYSYPSGKKRMGRPPSDDPGGPHTLWLPHRLWSVIEEYKQFRGIPKGAAAAELIDAGLDAIRATFKPKSPLLKSHAAKRTKTNKEESKPPVKLPSSESDD